MIKVISGTSLNKTELVLDPSTTILEAAEQANLNVAAGGITLNDSVVGSADFNKTFADYGVTDKCYLLQVVKADNA